MLFNIAVTKNIFISGKVKIFKAGSYETTDKAEIKALNGAINVTAAKKAKSE